MIETIAALALVYLVQSFIRWNDRRYGDPDA